MGLAARGALAATSALAIVALYASCWERNAVRRHDLTVSVAGLPADFEGYRILHVSDLEAVAPGVREERVARIGRSADPDLVVVTGDIVRKSLDVSRKWIALGKIASWMRTLPSRDGVWFVQGHGEMASQMDEEGLRAMLRDHGVSSLWDETHLLVRGSGRLALAGVRVHDYGSRPVWELAPGGIRQGPCKRPGYLELAGDGLLDLAEVEITGRLRFSDPEDWVGIVARSRLSAGEDRLYKVLRRSHIPFLGAGAHGTLLDAEEGSWSRSMQPDLWHRFRVRAANRPGTVEILARAWPDGSREPEAWDLSLTDSSASRIPSGAPGIYAEGPGVKQFEDLQVWSGGRLLQGEWREPAGSDQLIDLISRCPSGVPMILLSHTPDIFPEAAEAGVALVLSGHTQGGQIRLPWVGALVTDTALGRTMAAGLFRRRESALFVNRGVGTSRIPARFLSPPEAAVITLTGAAR